MFEQRHDAWLDLRVVAHLSSRSVAAPPPAAKYHADAFFTSRLARSHARKHQSLLVISRACPFYDASIDLAAALSRLWRSRRGWAGRAAPDAPRPRGQPAGSAGDNCTHHIFSCVYMHGMLWSQQKSRHAHSIPAAPSSRRKQRTDCPCFSVRDSCTVRKPL